MVLLILLASWMSDASGYFVGRYCGRYRFLPKISPRKTLEGLIASLIGSMLFCGLACMLAKETLLPHLQSVPLRSFVESFAWGAAIAILGFVGDLLGSVSDLFWLIFVACQTSG